MEVQIKQAINKWILGGVANPAKTKYSPHALYFKRHKKNKDSPYWESGSNNSNNGGGNHILNKSSFRNEYAMDNSGNSNLSHFGSSSSSNPSNLAVANENVRINRNRNKSEEKHLEPTQRDDIRNS